MGEKKVYLLLTDTGSLFAKLIKSYTKKPFNHASIAFDQELLDVYSFGRKNPRNPFLAGFVKEDIQSVLFHRAQCAIYAMTVTDRQFYKMKQYVQIMYEHKEHFHYNLLGLFGLVLNKPIQRENAFFCSQFVARILEDCDIMKFEKDFSLIAPHDLPVAIPFECIYEGALSDYRNQFVKTKRLLPRVYMNAIPSAQLAERRG